MRFFWHFSQSFSLYRTKLEIKISFLFAFFAYIRTFVEWMTVCIFQTHLKKITENA